MPSHSLFLRSCSFQDQYLCPINLSWFIPSYKILLDVDIRCRSKGGGNKPWYLEVFRCCNEISSVARVKSYIASNEN